jgi:hypothetical protein
MIKRSNILSLAVGTAIVLFAFGKSASAADVGAVTAACDRTAGCNYTINGAGDISGCSPHACFYCPNDGKRQCFPVGRVVPTGSKNPIVGITKNKAGNRL